MIRNKILSRFIVVTLTAALLLVTGSRAIRVSALADVAPDVAPVFDTQIYQIQDYIDNGMTDPQYEIFEIILGMLALSQSGLQDYKLVDPYQYQDGVWPWLKSMGIKTYNSLISLIPDTARMPITGDIYSTVPFKQAASSYVSLVMGIADEAKKYTTVQQFKDRLSQGSYYLPWNFDIQKGMNSIFGIYGGIYSWQFDSQPFTSNRNYITPSSISGVLYSQYNSYLAEVPLPRVRFNGTANGTNYPNQTSIIYGGTLFETYHLLFVNTSNNTVNIVDDSGNVFPHLAARRVDYGTDSSSGAAYGVNHGNYDISANLWAPITYDPATYPTYLQLVRDVYNGTLKWANDFVFLEDFIDHVYVGSNWLNKQEIYNLTDLNFDEPSVPNDVDYYYTVPDNTNYLIDLHDLVQDILNNTDLFQIILNHIVDINGVAVHDDELIKVTTSIYELLEINNPVLPVNLNDIAEYTDNSYLDRVKEEARRGGNELAALVAFWHNCEPEIVYVLFGAGITVLVGAFIGKWGHS